MQGLLVASGLSGVGLTCIKVFWGHRFDTAMNINEVFMAYSNSQAAPPEMYSDTAVRQFSLMAVV